METILSTNGYLLREWMPEDAKEYARLVQDESIRKRLRPGTPTTEEAFPSLLKDANTKT